MNRAVQFSVDEFPIVFHFFSLESWNKNSTQLPPEIRKFFPADLSFFLYKIIKKLPT